MSIPRHPDDAWPEKFSSTDPKAHPFFDPTYIDLLRDDWKRVDDYTVEDDDEDEDSENEDREGTDDSESEFESEDISKEDASPAGVFMKKRLYARPSETSENWHPGATIVCNFCHDIAFADLEKPDRDPDCLMFLEDASRDGVFLQSTGPLSPHELHHALKGPVQNDSRLSRTAPDAALAPSIYFSRRMSFLNITSKMAAVLMNTTKTRQASAVQDLLYRHIDRVSFLGMNVPSHGFKTFTFHLSIPSYSLQSGATIVDDRHLGEKQLRRTFSISNVGKFQEAHTSIILTGENDWGWTAIAMVDGARYTDCDLPPGCRRDHVAGVNLLAPYTESNARPYFLWVWKVRLEQILRDWTETVDTIIRAVDGRNQNDLSIMRSECNDKKIEKLAAAIDEVAQWSMEFDPMKRKLRSILDNWNNFRQPDGGEKYFKYVGKTPQNTIGAGDSFPALKALYIRGALLLTQFDDATSTLKEKLNQLHFAHGTSTKALADRQAKKVALVQEKAALVQEEAAVVQKMAANDARRASITSMFFLPAMVAFTLFSMEEKAIPFAANRVSLVIILGVFGLFTFLVFNCFDFIAGKGGDLGRGVRGLLVWLLSYRAPQEPGEVV